MFQPVITLAYQLATLQVDLVLDRENGLWFCWRTFSLEFGNGAKKTFFLYGKTSQYFEISVKVVLTGITSQLP